MGVCQSWGFAAAIRTLESTETLGVRLARTGAILPSYDLPANLLSGLDQLLEREALFLNLTDTIECLGGQYFLGRNDNPVRGFNHRDQVAFLIPRRLRTATGNVT